MTLTKKEVEKLSRVISHYPDHEGEWNIKQESTSGIGSNTYVEFEYKGVKMTADITDYSCW